MNRDEFEIKHSPSKGEHAAKLFLRCIVIPGLLAYAGWTYWRCREEADMLDDLEWRLYLDVPESEQRDVLGMKPTDTIETDKRIVSISPIYTLDYNERLCKFLDAKWDKAARERAFAAFKRELVLINKAAIEAALKKYGMKALQPDGLCLETIVDCHRTYDLNRCVNNCAHNLCELDQNIATWHGINASERFWLQSKRDKLANDLYWLMYYRAVYYVSQAAPILPRTLTPFVIPCF